jgi:hypothetical protein
MRMNFKKRLSAAIDGAMAANDGKTLAKMMKAFPAEFLKSSEARREPIVGGRSKYEPHTGAGEKARRRRQMEAR